MTRADRDRLIAAVLALRPDVEALQLRGGRVAFVGPFAAVLCGRAPFDNRVVFGPPPRGWRCYEGRGWLVRMARDVVEELDR